MVVRLLDSERDAAEWLRMRLALFGDEDVAGQQEEMAAILAAPAENGVFVAERPFGGLAGFIEVGIRKYAEGCTTSPVAYLEGWHVDADYRRQGVGRALVAAAEAWARQHGYHEIASDTQLDNVVSLAGHLALGYEEVERQICFIKKL
ncbi:MAG: GNAT family N-acetyltransferase [Anaerolineales bacterium]|nr:GNAT family N-acetyltransferase [Anaerolineales bacterium]MCB8965636.1 GNAT family N-acetyltransferase [Ardenticatenaceae bacterium]